MDKKIMYFLRSNNEYLVLNDYCTEEEGWKAAHEFMTNHGFEAPYIRTWFDTKGNKWFDVSSHTEFFVWGFL